MNEDKKVKLKELLRTIDDKASRLSSCSDSSEELRLLCKLAVTIYDALDEFRYNAKNILTD